MGGGRGRELGKMLGRGEGVRAPLTLIVSANVRCHLSAQKSGTSRGQKQMLTSLALVAHTCNPRYLGGRDQED
jgi:hypothetical protein